MYEFKAEDFRVIEEPEGSALTNSVMVTQGHFIGVRFRLGAVKPEPNGDEVTLNYDYEILDDAGHGVKALEANPDFIEIMNAFVGKSFNDYMTWLKGGKRD